MPAGYVDVVTAGSLGLPSRALVRTDRNNIAPRIGFAYRPFGGGSTVLRGGYGLYFDMMPIDLSASQTPFVFQETTFTNPATPTVVFPNVFPSGGTSGPSTVALPISVNPNLQLPYSHQWNATVEHERWGTGFRVSYVATLGREMWFTRDANAPQADDRLYVDKPRPFPRYPNINYVDNGATHDYHGVTLEAERRISKGLFFQVAYTAARDLGEDSRRDREPVRFGARARARPDDSGAPAHLRGHVRPAVRPGSEVAHLRAVACRPGARRLAGLPRGLSAERRLPHADDRRCPTRPARGSRTRRRGPRSRFVRIS